MPLEVVTGNLSYRVLNQNTGAVVIPDLPHLHQSTSTVRALQGGYSGASSLGDVIIPLPSPQSEMWKQNIGLYRQLAVGQKLEAFAGTNTGTPKFSWVITKLDQPLRGNWAIRGADTLYWLQQSQVIPGEVVSPRGFSDLINYYIGTREVVWDDDFANWNAGGTGHTSADYSLTGWSFTSADPYFGLPALTSTSAGAEATVVANPSSVALSNYVTSHISIQGVLVAGTDTTFAGEVGLYILADNATPTQNAVLGRLKVFQTGASTGLYNAQTEIFTLAAGVYTAQGSVGTGVLQGLRNVLPFELTITFYNYTGPNAAASNYVSVAINGKKVSSTWGVGSFTLPASGRVGMHFNVTAGGSPAVYVNRLKFHSRPAWADGSGRSTRYISSGPTSPVPALAQDLVDSAISQLDLFMLAQTFTNRQIRKDPGFGFKSDSLTWGAGTGPGADLSSSVVFEEGVNVVDAAVLPVGETYSTDAKVQAVPGSDSGGSIVWSRLAAVGDMVLTDTVADVGAPTYALIQRYARLIQQRKSNPMVAVQLEVTRTADTADKWRELDFVTVHLPTLGIFRQKTQIIGYNYVEGQATQTVWLTALPDTYLLLGLQRLRAPIDGIAAVYLPR